MNDVYLGIGSNLGDRKLNVRESIRLLISSLGRLEKISSLYLTEPWGFKSETYFLNLIIKINTNASPEEVLKEIMFIEQKLHRQRNNTTTYQARTIDIDILFYNKLEYNSIDLIIPHPRIADRLFVLLPLQEIEPNFIFPNNHHISTVISHCTDICKIRKLSINI